ncbi:hypothetical protein V3C33_10255 [Micrococcaceae bacterium Sec5.7]
MEIDLVGHEGGNSFCEFCFTLTVPDISTGGTVNRSVRNKAAKWVFEALEHVTAVFPFPSIGIDTDCADLRAMPTFCIAPAQRGEAARICRHSHRASSTFMYQYPHEGGRSGHPRNQGKQGPRDGAAGTVCPGIQIEIEGPGLYAVDDSQRAEVVADLSRWLQKQGPRAADVTSERIGQFVASRRSAGRLSPYPARAFNTMIEILIERGVMQVESKAPVPGSSIDALLGSFEKFLLAERD